MSDFSLRHDDCGLFRRAWERVRNCGSEDDSPLQSTPAYADAAGSCGRVLLLTNSGQAPFRSLDEQKAVVAPIFSFFLQTHSRACFIVGVRDAIPSISFSSAT
jgi:hypothetical protein